MCETEVNETDNRSRTVDLQKNTDKNLINIGTMKWKRWLYACTINNVLLETECLLHAVPNLR